MKKLFVVLIFTSFTIACSSQSQFGIFAGPQITSSKYTINGLKQKNTAKYGFQAGFGWKIPFDVNLYFSPAAFYSLKGYHVTFNQKAFPPDTTAIDNNTTIHTFELAFLLQYDLSKQANHLFIKLGPSLDFQLFGNEKFDRKNTTSVDRKMVFSFGDYGHYAASMLLHFGFESKEGLILSAQYTHGLGNINNADGGPKICHRVYGISIGKILNKKRIIIDTRAKE